MQQIPDSNIERPQRWWRSFWAIAGAITLLRVITLVLTPLGLGPDEAQYWFWSQDPAFGYFSKPPIVAWAIAATTSVFGDADWAVRLSAPFFHLGAASFIYLAGRNLFNNRAAFWAGLAWLVMPGVILSSFIMATDAPLLFFWSGALFFLLRILFDPKSTSMNFYALGAMIGFGLLSKYAMLYFLAATAAGLVFSSTGKRLLKPPLIVTGVIAFLLFLPNILWNAQHDFHTLSHTAANARWGAELIKPLNLIAFLGGQFAVFGIIPFAVFAYALFHFRKRVTDQRFLLLLIFSVTPLLIVAGQAFLSRAHANWAAAAYPAGTLLFTAILLEMKKDSLIKASIAIHSFIFVTFMIGVLNVSLIDRTGLSAAARDLRGWEKQTSAIMGYADGYDAVLIDDRYLMGEMLYHQKNSPVPLAAIDPNASIDNHYEAFIRFDPTQMKRVLFVTTRDDAAHVDYRFRNIKELGAVSAELDGADRNYTLFALSGYFGPGLEQP